ncbi:MAG: adenylosuccinate synthetase [Anaerolineae bacterium]|jgi:adenylosuccinate synthase
MSVAVVGGAQWGDEAKGRLVDYLAARADLQRIEGLAGAPLRFVSVGPERAQIVVLPA